MSTHKVEVVPITLKPHLNGAPVSVGRKQVRVKPGAAVPVLLSWGTSDDAHANGIEPARHDALVPHPEVAGLVESVSAGMISSGSQRNPTRN